MSTISFLISYYYFFRRIISNKKSMGATKPPPNAIQTTNFKPNNSVSDISAQEKRSSAEDLQSNIQKKIKQEKVKSKVS